MGEAVGDVFALGVGVALSPLAIVAVVVMLLAPNGPRSAWAFAGGWSLSLALVSTLVLLLAEGADANANGAPAGWVSVLKVTVGLLLVLFAARQWRGRKRGEGDTAPVWMRKLEKIAPAKAAGLAVLFNVVKPKNLLLSIGAGVAVAEIGTNAAGQAAGVAVFVVLGAAGPGVPLAIHVLMRRRGKDVLIGLRDWMVRNNSMIVAVLSLVIAAKLLGDALISLTS